MGKWRFSRRWCRVWAASCSIWIIKMESNGGVGRWPAQSGGGTSFAKAPAGRWARSVATAPTFGVIHQWLEVRGGTGGRRASGGRRARSDAPHRMSPSTKVRRTVPPTAHRRSATAHGRQRVVMAGWAGMGPGRKAAKGWDASAAAQEDGFWDNIFTSRCHEMCYN